MGISAFFVKVWVHNRVEVTHDDSAVGTVFCLECIEVFVDVLAEFALHGQVVRWSVKVHDFEGDSVEYKSDMDEVRVEELDASYVLFPSFIDEESHS